MRIAFFHGLESPAVSDKTEALERMATHSYAPAMDYTDPGLFKNVLEQVKEQEIDLLVGSSMGGWFAHCLSTMTGLPALLFNPAVHGRSMEPVVETGKLVGPAIVVLGETDTVINPQQTREWFEREGQSEYKHFVRGEHGHRTPIDVFIKSVGLAIQTFDK